MTQAQVDAIKSDIELAATIASPVISNLMPGAVVWLIIGKAVAKQVPELVAIVEKWVKGTPPTQEELAVLNKQLAVLSDPNLP